MTWDPSRRRWQKMHRGVWHKVSSAALGRPATKHESYQAADAWWRARLAEIETAPKSPVPSPSIPTPPPPSVPRPSGLTIGAEIDRWLAVQEARVMAGEASPGHLTNVRLVMAHFRDFIGGSSPVAGLDAAAVAGYHAHLLKAIGERMHGKGGLSRPTAAKYISTVRAFVRHLWTLGVIDMPRNLDSKGLAFRTPPKSVPTMPTEDIREILEAATGQLKLHLLLMLNCGFTQTDVADLADGEVDWGQGRIVRARSKTRDAGEDVPTVDYKLWPETFALLKRFKSGGPIVLLTRNGTRWVWEEVDPGTGKVRSNDSIATLYNHLRRKLHREVGRKFGPLKILRKTSASMVENHPIHGKFSSHFLGHSPRSVKDRHYIRPDTAAFDAAVAWLRDALGLDPRPSGQGRGG